LAYCGSGSNRKLARAGVLDILPVHYSQLPGLIRSGGLRIDVVMLQVPPPDDLGRYSLGLAREYLVEAVKHARAIVAEVHP
ncbi:acetyl-CoA hydrolase, partial [Mycobacterium tuberculosis]|nr:acetyl-CoA hydrolase [Mycobacterium tuberculosis]